MLHLQEFSLQCSIWGRTVRKGDDMLMIVPLMLNNFTLQFENLTFCGDGCGWLDLIRGWLMSQSRSCRTKWLLVNLLTSQRWLSKVNEFVVVMTWSTLVPYFGRHMSTDEQGNKREKIFSEHISWIWTKKVLLSHLLLIHVGIGKRRGHKRKKTTMMKITRSIVDYNRNMRAHLLAHLLWWPETGIYNIIHI